MSNLSAVDSLFHGRLRAATGRLFWIGVAMLIIGLIAIVFPILSSLVATLFVGWILLIAGILAIVASFSIHGTGPFFGALLIGLMSTAAGVFLAFNPLAGAVALTLMVGAVFMVQGVSEIVFALQMRPHNGWVGMLVSGLASAVLAIIIIAGWPGASVGVLGILLGINFLTTGIGYIMVSRAVRDA